MNDRLKQLLTHADASATTPVASDGLAGRVRAHRIVRRRNRAISAGCAVLLLAFVLTIPFWQSDHPAEHGLTHAIASLDADIALHLTTAARLAEDRPKATQRNFIVPDEVQFHRDRAALVLIYEADHQVDHDPAAALAEYRRAIELFPQSQWAEIARQRIRQIES